MTRAPAAVLAAGIAACGGGAPDTGGDAPPRLLWVGAHPDDEVYAAPLIADLCLDEGYACTLAVVTRGESGSCGLPDGCEPDRVLTLDPRHGSTCHPAHRAVGALVAEAAASLGWADRVAFLAGHAVQSGEGVGFEPVVADDPTVTSWDATRVLAATGAEAWDVLLAVMAGYASQFTDAQRAALAAAPDALRAIPLAPQALTWEQDWRYRDLCAPSTF